MPTTPYALKSSTLSPAFGPDVTSARAISARARMIKALHGRLISCSEWRSRSLLAQGRLLACDILEDQIPVSEFRYLGRRRFGGDAGRANFPSERFTVQLVRAREAFLFLVADR